MCASRANVMSPRTLRKLGPLAFALAALVAACSSDVGQGSENAEPTDACVECQTILVECSSTSVDETDFVACRDQWQECQIGRGLGPDMCGNPRDNEACDLCRNRMQECRATTGDDAGCEQQFSVCKAFLITRTDIESQCTADDVVPPEVSCGICQKDYAVCLSDPTLDNALAVCSTKFESCLGAHTIDNAVCATPSGTEACVMCVAQHDECQAAAGPNCVDGFGQCSTTLASGLTCEVQAQGGTGGAGGAGGAGGGGTVPGGCAHNECAIGLALDKTCSSCADEVCTTDSWCCENEWDDYCVTAAQAAASCSCS
jgi:hypothetical protein